MTSLNTSFTVNNHRNVNKCQFLISFTQISIWSNIFFRKGFTPIVWSEVHNSHTQCDFPCKRRVNNGFCGVCSNNNFDSKIGTTSNVCKSRNKDTIVKLGSFGHNSLEYCAYFSSSCPYAIIPMKIMSNCPSPYIILLQTCNFGSAIFAWSVLSWIMNSSFFNHIDYILQVWYKFLHNFWCKICFINFPSYSLTLLFFPTFNIKSLKDSQTMHLANTNLCFRTSTFRWCLFLNLLMVDWEIPPMINSLLICNNIYEIKEV